MMTRFGKWLATTSALAAITILGSPRDAHAILELRAFLDGSAVASIDVTDAATPGTITLPNGTVVGPLTVNGSISTSNYLSPDGLAQIASQSLNVINNTGATHTVLLQISSNGFTAPPSPLALFATASGTFSPVTGTGNTSVGGSTAVAQAFASSANTLFGNTFQTQNFNAGTAAAGSPLFSYSNSASNSPFAFAGAYSMTLQLAFTLPGNVQLNGRANVEQAVGIVPEPATMAMAFAGLPVLGGYWLRRRRKQA